MKILDFLLESANIGDKIKNELGLQSLIVTENDNTITLHSLVVGEKNRKKGLGTAAMRMLTDYADKVQKRIVLTPASENDKKGTTSRSRLVKFYKQFGFVESKGRNIDYTIGAGKMYREPKLKESAWMPIRFMMMEGGWAYTSTQRTVITPKVVKNVLAIMKQFENDFNSWLRTIDIPEIKIGRPIGSTAYYNKDDVDKVYGDIDLQIIAPEIKENQNYSQFSKFWNKLVDQFIENKKPNYFYHKEYTTGHPIVKIGKDKYVQIDFMWHPERLADWGAARVTPERGIKGLLTGNMFSVFGEIMNMSIQHAGVQLKLSNGEIVPFSKRKNTELITVTTNPKTFLLDTFKWLAARQGMYSPKIDKKLTENPGIDINDVKISKLVQGIKGFANSLEINGLFGKKDLSNFANYDDFMKKFVSRYTEKARLDIENSKRDKAKTPEAIKRAETDKQKIKDGLSLVLQMLEVDSKKY
jgi:hypothetical protein